MSIVGHVRAKQLQSCPTLCDPMEVALQVPLSMEFSRQEYWSVLPFPPPGDLPDPGMDPTSPALNESGFTYQHNTFIGRTDAEAETPILWPPDAKS